MLTILLVALVAALTVCVLAAIGALMRANRRQAALISAQAIQMHQTAADQAVIATSLRLIRDSTADEDYRLLIERELDRMPHAYLPLGDPEDSR